MLWLTLMTVGQEIRTLLTVCLGSSIFKGDVDQKVRNHGFSQYGKLLDLYFVQCMLQIFSQGLSHHLGLCDGRFICCNKVINRFRLVQIFFISADGVISSKHFNRIFRRNCLQKPGKNKHHCVLDIDIKATYSLKYTVIGNCFKVPWS